MGQYIIRRVLLGALTMVLVSLLIFVIMRIAPGDVAALILGEEEGAIYTEEDLQYVRKQLGLDRPLPVQYFVWMRDMVTFNWGNSLFEELSIWDEFRKRAPITLQLVTMTVVVSLVLGIPTGIIMALKQDTRTDYFLRIWSLAGLSVPNFWIATMIITGGVIYFNWSPRLTYVSFFDDPLGNLDLFLLPSLALGYSAMATKARMMRSTMLEVLRQDYIRTAHAKGLGYYVVVYRHAMKNALLPVVTIIGITIALSMGGSVIIESIFLLPGIGQYLIGSMQSRDYPVTQTLVMVFAGWVVMTNLVVDLAYGWLDPRIRLG